MLTKSTRVSKIKIDTDVENEKTEEIIMAGKAEKTREYILDEAFKLFCEKGFKQVTMKDICEITGMSRGGLYSHFASTSEVFEALLERIATKDSMDFEKEIKAGTPARKILKNALSQMETEIKNPEESLSIAMYEYADSTDSNVMVAMNKNAVKRWTSLINYGIKSGEFEKVNVSEIVNVILFSYQGIRMWSRIAPLETKTYKSVLKHIEKQLISE